MSYFDWLESRLDYITGTPCANCECAPAAPEDLFCTDECRDEYEGNDTDD